MNRFSLSLGVLVLALGLARSVAAMGSVPILVFPGAESEPVPTVTRACSGVAVPCPPAD